MLNLNLAGQLRSTPRPTGRPFLLQVDDPTCSDTDDRVKCFASGEGRTNENLGLVSIHTVFMRFHNKVAMQLATLQPTWSDEELYQQARRIVLSVYQHITYNEFVPTVIGFNAAKLFEILPLRTKTYFSGYDQNVRSSEIQQRVKKSIKLELSFVLF
jgi:peroxidase